MKIDVSKLHINLPDGVTKKSEPVLDPDGVSVRFVVTGNKAEAYDIGISYNNGEPVNCKLKVQDATLLKIADNILGVSAGSSFTVRAQFDIQPVLSKANITVPSDWIVSKAAAVEGNDIVAVYTTKDINASAKISVEYLGVTKELTIDVRDPNFNSFLTLTSDKAEYSVGEDIMLTATYKYDVVDKDKPALSGALPEGVKEKSPLTKSGKTWVTTYTAETVGEKQFTFVAYQGDKVHQVARLCKVTVK